MFFTLMPVLGYSQISFPDLKGNGSLKKNFRIQSIEVTDKNTILKFTFTNNYDGAGTVYMYPPGHKNAFYIHTPEGNYKLLSVQDIGDNVKPWHIGMGQTINFSAKFQPIPKSTKTFDLIEGQSGNWSLYGIVVPNNQVTSTANCKLLMPMSAPEYYVEGTWSGKITNGLAQGKGVFSSEKLYFSGNIKDGKISGYSECHLKKREARVAGNFIDGKISGEGVITFDTPINMGVWYGTEEVKYIMTDFVNGLPNGKAFSYRKNGALILIGNCTNGQCEYTSKPPGNYDINDILVGAGFVLGAIYVSKHGIEGLSNFYSKYGSGLISCGLQYNVGNQISNPYIAAIVTEAIGSTVEKRKYSQKNVSVQKPMANLRGKHNFGG